jgi:hypothetical protein
VTFNGKAATITSDTPSEIKVRVPTGAKTGYVQVTAAHGKATSATRFKVT